MVVWEHGLQLVPEVADSRSADMSRTVDREDYAIARLEVERLDAACDL
jgi:hypothetical protein